MRKTVICILSVMALMIGVVTSAYGYGTYLTTPGTGFNARYPGAGALSTCQLCHINPAGGGARNPYGVDFASAGHNFAAIESLDSDGDTFNNGTEINAGTWPGDGTSHPAITTACTDYSYSNWSACLNGQQTRTATPIPAGCSGTPPVTQLPLTQSCNSVPPPTSGIPLPTGKQVFTYGAVAMPVLSSDPAAAKPIGVGPVASGGTTVDISVNIGPFASPVDVSLALYVVGVDSGEVYLLNQWNSFESVHYAVAARAGRSASEDEGDGENSSEKNENLTIWKKNVTGVNQHIYGPSPVSDLPPGPYILVLGAVPSGPGNKDDRPSYHWVTYFIVP